MTSSSPTPACCPPGSWPQLLRPRSELNQDDAPALQGNLVTVSLEGDEDLVIYHVSPPPGQPSKGAIMVLPDIYSVRALIPTVRSGDRIGSICDALAMTGYTVALPDIFLGKPFDVAVSAPADGVFEKFNSFAQEGGVAWFQAQTYAKLGPVMKAAAAFLTKETGGQSIGVLGFCFGTWLLSKTSAMGDVDFCCAVGCHPATVLESAVFGGDEVAMLNSLKQPTTFLWAGNDSEIYKEEGAGKLALENSGGGVVEFRDMLHGWVSRGDVADETVKRDVEKALELIIGFFADKMPKPE